jgi:NAD(P)-dependent dehydrogenase (short-subunit alcohol dehydrogenase family)
LESFTSQGLCCLWNSRNPERVKFYFSISTLDVRNSESIEAAVAKIIASSGRLDIV